MTDKTKNAIIFLSISCGGTLVSIVFSKYTNYAFSFFLCFPLGLNFLLRKKVYFSYGGELSLVWRFIIGFIFIGLGIYSILYVNNIVP